MANITPYDPGQLPNRVVGTPGVGPAGQAEIALSKDAMQAEQGLAQLGLQQANFQGSMLHQFGAMVGHELGKGIHALMASDHASNTMNQTVATQQYVNTFQEGLDKGEPTIWQQQGDSPGDVPDNFMQWAKQGGTTLDGKPSFVDSNGNAADMASIMAQARENRLFKNDPTALGKLQNELQSRLVAKYGSIQHTALGKLTAIGEAIPDQQIESAVNTISSASGGIETLLPIYQQAKQNYGAGTSKLPVPLGEPFMKAKQAKLEAATGQAMFQTALANIDQNDPEKALGQVQQIKKVLQGNVQYNVPLDAQVKERMLSSVDAAERQQEDNLVRQLNVDLYNDDLSLTKYKSNMNVNWNAETTQQNGIAYAQQQIETIDQTRRKIVEGTYPDRVKVAYLQRLNAQEKTLNGIVDEGQKNQKYIDTLRKQGEAAALAEKRAAEREARQTAREDLKMNKDETLANWNDLQQKIFRLSADIPHNMDELGSTATQALQLATKAGDAGYISRQTQNRFTQDALNIVKSLATYKKHTPNWQDQMGLWGKQVGRGLAGAVGIDMPEPEISPAIKLKGDDAMQAQAAALRDAQKTISNMRLMNKQVKLSEQYFAGNEEAKAAFESGAEFLLNRANKEGATSDQLNAMLLRLRNAVINEHGGPKAEPPKAGFVAPPAAAPAGKPVGLVTPGNIDLNHRPVVHNANGTISTVRSISIEADGKAILIPTVIGNKVVSNEEARQHFRKTGQHLGIFDTEAHANAYAEELHNAQAQHYGKGALVPPPPPEAQGFMSAPPGKHWALVDD